MATLLARLGGAAARRAWLVIVAWVLILGGILGGAVALGPDMREEFAIPGTESQTALDRLSAVFPQVAGASVQVVVEAPEGVESERGAIEALGDDLGELDGVDSVLTPWDEFAGDQISDDGTIAYLQVQYDTEAVEVSDAQIADLVATGDAAESGDLRVEMTSQIFAESSVAVTIVEAIGVVFAGVVLIIAFWSVVAAGLPIIIALVSVGITMGGVLGASSIVTVSNSAPLMALMIGLAVGIDYALFIVSKYRLLLARGAAVDDAIRQAVGTSGTAVVFAGVTVVIALMGLLIVGIPFLSVMGIGAAFSVVVAVAAATTLLPAMLAVLGERLRPNTGSRAHQLANRDPDENPTFGMRWARLVTRRPMVTLLAGIVALGVLAVPAFSLQLALPDNGGEREGTTAREGYDLLAEGFGPGAPGPLVVMVDITQVTDVLGVLDEVADDLEQIDGVASVGSRFPDATIDTAIIQVFSDTAPSSPETVALVERIREAAPELGAEHNVELAVTGTTAVQIDISSRLGAALLPFGIVVVSLAIILLLMVFRSIAVPIAAAVGFVLSMLGSLGITVAAFQWGWLAPLVHAEAGPLLSFMPVLVMAVLFGLAMDYQVFLVSGIREVYVHGERPRPAIHHGVAANARVVVAAALIMIFVFAAFVPEGMATIKPIALALAAGVAIDAFIVRLTLMPALLALLGERAWWMPAWLDRLLPNADVEGAQLAEQNAHAAWATKVGGHVALDGLVVGYHGARAKPLSANWSKGSVVRIGGTPLDVHVLTQTLAGRIPPVAGRLHVDGQRGTPSSVATLDLADERDGAGAASERIATALQDRPQLLVVEGAGRLDVPALLQDLGGRHSTVLDTTVLVADEAPHPDLTVVPDRSHA